MRTFISRILGRGGAGPADRLYDAIVAQARRRELYHDFGVPDTVDGRFEMIVLHGILLFDRLEGEGEPGSEIGQAVFDTMFADLDASLREMGVGDLSVGRRIRTMAEAFYGRAAAYRKAFEDAGRDPGELRAALRRNVFADCEPPPGALDALADYVIRCREVLAVQSLAAVAEGAIYFFDPAAPPVGEQHDGQGRQ